VQELTRWQTCGADRQQVNMVERADATYYAQRWKNEDLIQTPGGPTVLDGGHKFIRRRKTTEGRGTEATKAKGSTETAGRSEKIRPMTPVYAAIKSSTEKQKEGRSFCVTKPTGKSVTSKKRTAPRETIVPQNSFSVYHWELAEITV